MRDDTTFASETDTKAPGITDAARKVSEGIGELRRAIGNSRETVVEPMSQFIQEKPLAAVGVAFGVGYILGGGLFTGLTGRLIGMGWRVGAMALAKNVLGNLGQGSRY